MSGYRSEEEVNFTENGTAENTKLKNENEKFRQEIYELRRKLELNRVMLKEIQETNESHKQSLIRQLANKENIVLDLNEKHRSVLNEYQADLTNLEAKLTEKTAENQKLQDLLDERNQTDTTVSDQSTIASLENDVATSHARIDQLKSLLQEEMEKRERVEEKTTLLENYKNELEQSLTIAKKRLTEETAALEVAREELALMRTQTLTANDDYTPEQCKGNSLFAEVEDRRKNTIDKFTVLQKKYENVKQMYKAKTAEVKELKNERVAFVKRYENSRFYALPENDELIDKYKERVSDLENKLKFELKKNVDRNESMPADNSPSYLETLLAAKKKEVAELKIKIENYSTRILLQEEANVNLSKKLDFWRHKAACLEVEILSTKADVDLESPEGKERELVSTKEAGRKPL